MEDLIAQFSFLSDEALHDKSFDPTSIEGLMKLFEVEAYNSWAAMELSCSQEAEEAQISLQEAEDCLESAMEEFQRETERSPDAAHRVGSSMEKAATGTSKVASMRSALKGLSSSSQKVHPS